MKKSLIALALGAFALGAAEFVMMGILPQTAHDMNVTIPQAGHYISAYAIGVCAGSLILVFGRKIPPKRLVLMFMALVMIGNAMSALSTGNAMLVAARFISGLPHGAFFGTATLIAKTVADKGREAQAVSVMVAGQTIANMLGVPAGTLLGEFLSWRLAFVVLAVWAAATIVLSAAWIPALPAVKDVGLAGQFRFLRRRGPWLILAAVFLGNCGVFCWWSYISPWLTRVGGWPTPMVPALMVLAGLGMVVGGLAGGRVCDAWRYAGTAALGQAVSMIGLVIIFFLPGGHVGTAVMTFCVAFGMFFISSPQQLLMANAGKGGGELVGGASVQIAFNLGNAGGSIVGGLALDATGMDYHFSALAGAPLALLAVLCLAVYSVRHETNTDAYERMRHVEV